ncbi:hypothetical protein AO284_00520 [Pseudomonas sp. NZIPFR-PS2]|nr:hypothetical protein AO284_00520 [Pseudomonas sp. NZIPFR-PS2]
MGQAGVQFVEGVDDLRQRSALATQFLGVFRFVPDSRIFKLAIDSERSDRSLMVLRIGLISMAGSTRWRTFESRRV